MSGDKCGKCKNNIDNADIITCYGQCKQTFHFGCVGLVKSHLKIIKEVPNIFWYCNSCVLFAEANLSQQIRDEIGNALKPFTTAINAISSIVPSLKKISDHSPLAKHRSGNPFSRRDFPNIHNGENSAKRRRDSDFHGHGSNHNNGISNSNAGGTTPNRLGSVYRDKLLYGTGNSLGKLKGVGEVDQQSSVGATKEVYISKLDRDTTEKDIIDFLTDAQVIADTTTIKCVKLIKVGADLSRLNWVSFKLVVPDSLFDSIVDRSVWPPTVAVREFVNIPRASSSGTSLRLNSRRNCDSPVLDSRNLGSTSPNPLALSDSASPSIAQGLDEFRADSKNGKEQMAH